MCKRGYRKSTIEGQLKRIDGLDRESLIKYKTCQKSNERVPLVLTYCRGLPNIHAIIKNRMSILHMSDRLRAVFEKPPIVAYRRGQNLMDMVVHKKTSKLFAGPKCNGMKTCKHKKCAMCKHVKITNTLKTPTGEIVQINQKIDCKTYNVVYAVVCKKCDRTVYVGETGTTMYTRIMNHLSNIRNHKVDAPVASHFISGGHKLMDFQVAGIEVVKEDSVIYRRIRESYWIKKMDTVINGENRHQ